MFEELRLILIIIIMVAGLITVWLSLRKDKKYTGNRLLALAFLMVGIYGISMLIHDGIAIGEVIIFTDQLNYSVLLFAVSFLFLTMQVIVNTTAWLKERRHLIPVIILDMAFAVLVFAWTDAISVESLSPPNTKTNIIVDILLGAGVLYFVLYSIYAVYNYGIKKTEGKRKTKMKIVCAGFICIIGAFFANVVSNLVDNAEMGAIFDVIYFGVLAGSMVMLAVGFLRPAD